MWIVEPNIKRKEEAVEKFIPAFSDANVYAMNHPKEAGNFSSKCFKQYFGSAFPAKAVENLNQSKIDGIPTTIVFGFPYPTAMNMSGSGKGNITKIDSSTYGFIEIDSYI